MARTFNTAGPCLAEKHYMIPAGRRLAQIRDLIDRELYFAIHAPRQTGKTTLLRNLSRELTEEGAYAAVTSTVEDITHADVDRAMAGLTHNLLLDIKRQLPPELLPEDLNLDQRPTQSALRFLLTRWTETSPRPVVLLLDEVDALQPEVLLSVLRQLRAGYTSRPAPFPHSLALVGLRDVRDYRAGVRSDAETLGTSSPFNIKSESLTLRNFTEEEVRELLLQHTAETGQRWEEGALGEVFGQAQGQPWLTNALADLLTTHYDPLVKDRAVAVTRKNVLEARELLIQRRDTHLDSLVARLQEARVRRALEPILTGEMAVGDTYDDDFSHTRDLGLVVVRDGVRAIANPIYAEIVTRVLTHQVQTAIPLDTAWYIAPDGRLDMDKLIEGFIEFWRENGEVLLKGMPYQEAAPHLAFMAFLQRVVNAGGAIAREFAVGTKRADLVVAYGGRKDVIELKLQRSPRDREKGIQQTAAYAKRLGRDVGYLVLFSRNSDTPWEERGEVSRETRDGVEVVVLSA